MLSNTTPRISAHNDLHTHSSLLTSLMLLLSLILCLLCSVANAQLKPQSSPYSIEGKPATQAVLTIGSRPSPSDIARSPMLRELANIAAVWDAKDLSKLRRSTGSPFLIAEPYSVLGTLELSRTSSSTYVSIITLDGEADPDSDQQPLLYILTISQDEAWAHRISPEVLGHIPVNERMLRSIQYKDPHRSVGQGVYTQPYFESPTILDTKVIKSRIRQRYPDLTRTLSEENLRVRTPRPSAGDDQLPGILVWISPTPNGQIPQTLHDACDELNLIAVGADNNGNPRSLTDRLQIHLDSITTIQTHYQTDPRRVYVTGMSGGGRCSSILQLAFPDIFMGAVPIVGLDSYHRTPTGAPNRYYPERLSKPSARWMRLLKDRRFACITGSMDFNEPEMQTRSAQMKKDKLKIRLDVIDGMGHTMPSPAQFTDALTWVDELQSKRISRAQEQAAQDLESCLSRYEDPAEDLKARTLLIQITIDAPWSLPAYEAARILGFEQVSTP
ncbi:MAG: hypothetical protein AB8C13_01580 [Phycisphaerales bacterium]